MRNDLHLGQRHGRGLPEQEELEARSAAAEPDIVAGVVAAAPVGALVDGVAVKRGAAGQAAPVYRRC